MDENKTAIYCRVSTEQQELEQQLQACRRFCEAKGWQVAAEFAEIGSGKNFARPQFQALLKQLRAGAFQSLVVFRFDRLGRNSREVALLFDELERRGVTVASLNENLDTSSPIGRAMREIILVLAQLERENISEATKQRLQALKNLGKKLGRKPREFDAALAFQMRQAGQSWRKLAVAMHCPQSTVRKKVNAFAVQKRVVENQLAQALPASPPVQSSAFNAQS